ncbi:MAG TPA: hypothetical protein VMV92_30200 [Streptosporangiaceae bacterium]|nr:hypothetical protein [Streptosporangiaceae bacterium]
MSYSTGPPMIVPPSPMSWQPNVKDVTTPKFPPPPRSAQNRSLWELSLEREVDDQGVVPDPEAACVVAAAADGDPDVVFPAEPDTGDDVGGAPAACNSGRVLVDHGVVDGARLVIAGISRHDQVTAQGGGQFCIRRGGDGGWCGSHVAFLRVPRSRFSA